MIYFFVENSCLLGEIDVSVKTDGRDVDTVDAEL